MVIELDHIFILTEAGAAQAEWVVATGLVEGSSNSHPGQGTSNRRFYFENTTLEKKRFYTATTANIQLVTIGCSPNIQGALFFNFLQENYWFATRCKVI